MWLGVPGLGGVVGVERTPRASSLGSARLLVVIDIIEGCPGCQGAHTGARDQAGSGRWDTAFHPFYVSMTTYLHDECLVGFADDLVDWGAGGPGDILCVYLDDAVSWPEAGCGGRRPRLHIGHRGRAGPVDAEPVAVLLRIWCHKQCHRLQTFRVCVNGRHVGICNKNIKISLLTVRRWRNLVFSTSILEEIYLNFLKVQIVSVVTDTMLVMYWS